MPSAEEIESPSERPAGTFKRSVAETCWGGGAAVGASIMGVEMAGVLKESCLDAAASASEADEYE